ncbi:uncharacterized protein LOC144114981 isoform X19 [Amblyomma americanum]
MDNPQSNESSAAESRPETNLDLPASSMEAPTSGSHGAVANQEHSLRNYEQNIISLRQENLRLRLRSFYLQLQTKTPAEENENEFQKNVAEQIQKFVTELDERDKLLDESRTKREELEKLVANLIHEKAALEDELCKWKMKTNVSEAAQDDNVKMVSTLSHVKKELEDKVKQLEQQLDELKDKKVPSLKRQLDTRTAALQAISAHAAKQEEALKSLHNVHSLCSLIQPKTEAFLQLIDDSLAAGDIQATQRAKNDFQRELSKISSEHCSFQLDSTEQPCSVAAFSDRVWKLEAELQSRENLIECLNSDIACLTSRLEATQTRCLEYETEMKRASEIHQKICAEKDKLLDSVQRKMQEMERHAQEGLSPKSRTSELQLECNRLHIAVLEKSRFINELLSERNKATVETEKSFHELLLSMKQKDQLIEMMQTKFEHAEEGEAVIENEGLRQPNPADFLLETCEGQPKPAEPGTPLGTERPSFQGSSPASPEGPDEPTVFYLSQSVPREVKVLYQILSDLAQESGIMPELSTVALTNISCIQKVTEILKSAHEKGLRFSLPIQSTIVNMDSLDHCEPDERGLAAWEPTVLVKLGEKLQQLAYLFAVDGPVVSKWQMADVVQLLDTVLEKAKQEAANKLFLHRSPEDLPPVLFGKGGQPKEHEELTHSAMLSPHLRNERGHSDISDYQEELLQDLGSALKCVGDLHNEVKALPLTPTSNETRKSTGSTDELIFAVDSSGQLVPVPVDQAGHFEKDASSQTEEPCDNLESLKSELNNAKAQVVSKHKDESLSEQAGVAVVQALEEKNAALQEQLHQMQEVSTVLLCRLEELAAFLEQLLAYDETGSLGSVTLSADMVAKIRQLVADSKDFSLSFSQSFLGSDNNSALSDHLLKRGSFDRSMQSILSRSKGKNDSISVIDKPQSCKLDINTIPPCPEDIAFMEDELKTLRDRVQEQQSEISSLTRRLEEEGSERASPAAGGRSKRAVSASHTKAQKLEKLLRRIQHCNSRLEDTLTVHKELCQKLLRIPSGDGPKDASESQQPKDLTESLVPSMRKLQFRLEEMVINNEVLQEILTEHVASGKAVLTEPCTPGGAGANSKEGAAEELNQCKKELACKERREDILKRAMVHEQDAKVQLEKELADCQKELQSLHEAHCALEKQYKTAVQRNSDLALRDPQRRSSFEKSRLERARGSSFERPDGEEMKLRDENHTLTAELRQQAQEIARLGKEEALHKDEVSNLSQEKTVLSQKLQAVQHEHEVLLESSSNKISELVTKLGALSTQNKNQHEEIRNLREMGESISRENIKLKHDLDATSSELEGLRVENQDLRETLLALRKQESLLRKNLEKAVDEQQAAKKISDEYSQSNKLLRMEKDQLGAKISDLSSRLDALECEKQSLYEEKQRLILEVSAGEDEVERVNSKLQSCEEECNNLRTQKSEVEAELQACNNKLQEFEHLAEQLREELSATKGKLESMDTRCNHLEQELGASKEAHKQLLWKRDELQRTLEAVGREAQQSKSLARMSLDKKHVMAFMELQDKSRSLQNVVMELKLKLERAMYENKCLRLELRVNEQFQSGNSSGAVVGTPDSLRSFATAASNASPPRLSPHQVPVDSSQRTPPVVGQHSCSHSRSYHTSPDLGIDSDPTPEHDVYSTAVEPTYVEHWQHRMGPDWSISSVHSAPDAFGGSCLLCQQGKDSPASWKFKANATYGGEQLDHPSTQSPSKSGFPVISCSLSSPGVHLCAIVQLSDHELLKKRVDESICLIRRVEASVQQALDALADFASDCTEPPECNRLLQDAERGCQSIKMCLMDSFKLICSFTMAQMPEAKEEHSFEHKQLRMELNKLQEKHSQQSAELQNALDQISSLKEKKEGMERAISRQLNKTKMVLKQTKGNLNVLRARDAKPEKK